MVVESSCVEFPPVSTNTKVASEKLAVLPRIRFVMFRVLARIVSLNTRVSVPSSRLMSKETRWGREVSGVKFRA